MIKLQCTLFSTTNKYKPISTIIKLENAKEYNDNPSKVRARAIANICARNYTTWDALKRNGFIRMKTRVLK